MKLDLDDSQLREIMSAAVLQVITAESKERLLKQAVEYLMTEEPDPYDRNKKRRSPLQAIFSNALENVSRDIIREMLTDPASDLNKQVHLIISEAATKFVGHDRDKLTEKLAEKIGEGLENAASSRY